MVKKALTLFAIAALLKTGLFAGELPKVIFSNPGVPWPATDSLGRTLPLAKEVGEPKTNRQVGIFYFLQHRYRPVIYDIAKILTENPNAAYEPNSPLWGGFHTPHFWGQPLIGYYLSDDTWVLRRHAQLLADAGVDTLIIDATNAKTYADTYMKLCEVFAAIRLQGERTPQVCFMVHTKAGETAQELYDELYKPGLYSDLWYRWQGKPLLICDPQEASLAVRNFFTLRRAHWPFTMVNTPYAWHWEDAYPQPYGFTTNRNKAEMINVSIAQNLRVKDGKVTDMSDGDARGRSFHNGHMDIAPGAINLGLNFQEQWNRALALDPHFVMITGWNEWNTSRFDDPADGKTRKRVIFMDQFGPEYSRDVEPMRGGFVDNYYYQMVANIRRYKGVPALPVGGAPQTISIAGSFDQWNKVEPEFRDHSDENKPRDYFDVTGKPITNHTGRNDLISMKVTGDEQNLYFYVRTREPITPSTNAAGLWLLLDTDQNFRTGWHGYDFIINRIAGCVERNDGGWNWQQVGKIEIRIAGNELQIAVSRALLGLHQKSSFDFKWADNLPQPCDIMDFYSDGDVAPEGRFNFRFIAP